MKVDWEDKKRIVHERWLNGVFIRRNGIAGVSGNSCAVMGFYIDKTDIMQ